MVSPLDWAIMKRGRKQACRWRAAPKGIDKALRASEGRGEGQAAPEKIWRYCTDAVLEAAENNRSRSGSARKDERAAPEKRFSRDEVKAYVAKNVAHLKIRHRKTIGATAGDPRALTEIRNP